MDGTALVRLAARDNAAWCGAVCRAHGLRGAVTGATAWTSPVRTPPLYPDAVTLAPSVPAEVLLARVDAGPGCAVKDSFADLDLSSAAGFTVLLEAEWIHRRAPHPPRPPVPAPGWAPVGDLPELAEWEGAWRGGPPPAPGTGAFPPPILADPAVVVVACRRAGRTVAGAVLHRAGPVVGVSNVFAADGDTDGAWAAAVAAVDTLHPGAAAVGYESGDDLAAARRHGFVTTGPLRVWIRGQAAPALRRTGREPCPASPPTSLWRRR